MLAELEMENKGRLGGSLPYSWSSKQPHSFSYQMSESLYPHGSQHVNVYRSFIYNCPKLEATKVSLNRWADKQTAGHPDNKTLFSNDERSSHKDMKATPVHIAKWKQSVWKGYYYATPALRHSGDSKEIKEEGRRNRWGSKDFQGSETISLWYCYSGFVTLSLFQTHRMYHTKNKS